MLTGLKNVEKLGLSPRAYPFQGSTLKMHKNNTCPMPLSIQKRKKGKNESKRKRWKCFGYGWTQLKWLHACIFRWQISVFALGWLFFCFSSAKSLGPEDSGLLLLNTMLFFACSAPRCTLALASLWFQNFSLDFSLCLIFGLVFLFVGKSRCILGRIKSEANYSLVWSWAVPKGVTFCMPSQGGRARSPFSTIPCIFGRKFQWVWKWMLLGTILLKNEMSFKVKFKFEWWPPSCWSCSCTRCPRSRRCSCRWSARCGRAASGRSDAWRAGPKYFGLEYIFFQF